MPSVTDDEVGCAKLLVQADKTLLKNAGIDAGEDIILHLELARVSGRDQTPAVQAIHRRLFVVNPCIEAPAALRPF